MKKSDGEKVRPYDLDQVSKAAGVRTQLRVRPDGGSPYDLGRVGQVNNVRNSGGTVTTVKRKG